jgi:acetyl-CoA carboxylase carboxyl transferase subunit alpha
MSAVPNAESGQIGRKAVCNDLAGVSLKNVSPWQHIEIARNPQRPHAPAFMAALFDDFFELHGDRHFADDKALLGGIACFEGRPVTVAGHVKGASLNENIACNFGMPHPEGYRKFIRLARQAEKFQRPLVTFIDTPGAYPGAEAEERGQGEAIARCLFELSGLTTPVIAVVIGEGGSGGALALGLADHIIMLEHAVFSVLSPEGFASILWKDARRAEEASEAMKLTAHDLYAFGMIDVIVPEPAGGAHNDPVTAIEAVRPCLRRALDDLSTRDTQTLLEARYVRYRKFGE